MSSKVESINITHSKDTVIDIRDLSKCYQIYSKPQHRLKQAFSSFFTTSFGRPLKQHYQELKKAKQLELSVLMAVGSQLYCNLFVVH